MPRQPRRHMLNGSANDAWQCLGVTIGGIGTQSYLLSDQPIFGNKTFNITERGLQGNLCI